MKDLHLIVWLTQLGISVVAPIAGFILLALWIKDQFSLGEWVIWVGIALGVISAVDGFCTSMKTLTRLSKEKKEEGPPPVAFNDHD